MRQPTSRLLSLRLRGGTLHGLKVGAEQSGNMVTCGSIKLIFAKIYT